MIPVLSHFRTPPRCWTSTGRCCDRDADAIGLVRRQNVELDVKGKQLHFPIKSISLVVGLWVKIIYILLQSYNCQLQGVSIFESQVVEVANLQKKNNLYPESHEESWFINKNRIIPIQQGSEYPLGWHQHNQELDFTAHF